MHLTSSDTKRTLMRLLLFTNSAQRELVSICTHEYTRPQSTFLALHSWGTRNTGHCTPYTVKCNLYFLHFTQYSVQCNLYFMHYTQYSLDCNLYFLHCTQYSLQCTLYPVHCTLYPVLILKKYTRNIKGQGAREG